MMNAGQNGEAHGYYSFGVEFAGNAFGREFAQQA